MTLDLDFIRAQYPVFSNPTTARWAMFGNAGGSYVPAQVTDRLHDFFQFTKVQPYGPFEASIAAGKAMDEEEKRRRAEEEAMERKREKEGRRGGPERPEEIE